MNGDWLLRGRDGRLSVYQLSGDAVVALAEDADDRVVAATSSPSTGQLLLPRRKDESGLALTAWQQV